MLKDNLGHWKEADEQKIKIVRWDMMEHMYRVRSAKRLEGEHLGRGRGIVLTAGNQHTQDRTLLLLRILRNRYNCTLPAEVFHYPGEMNATDAKKFEALNARAVEVKEATKDAGSWKSYQLKAEAILLSSFSDVLYLDSDNIPLRDPTFLFDSAEYAATGALFWMDFWKTHPSNLVWRVLNMDCRDEWEMESGQMVVDKKRHIAALNLAHFMCMRRDFWFQLSGGDKDTFRFAFYALSHPFHYPSTYLTFVGTNSTLNGEPKFC
ncbi:hypothetical protein HK104_003180, partial [Borealophlyctis nickersoniae]